MVLVAQRGGRSSFLLKAETGDLHRQERVFKTRSRMLCACVARYCVQCVFNRAARAERQGCKHGSRPRANTAGEEVGLPHPRLHRVLLSRHARHHLGKIAQPAFDRLLSDLRASKSSKQATCLGRCSREMAARPVRRR
jgi:hypothetical protein